MTQNGYTYYSCSYSCIHDNLAHVHSKNDYSGHSRLVS